ncbi:MAG: heavy-metal-associated domain-containing protein [Actinomycetota bacterium]
MFRNRSRQGLVELQVDGMHCSSCSILIDEALEEMEGIISSRTNLRRGRTILMTEPRSFDVELAKATLSELGYRAQPIL